MSNTRIAEHSVDKIFLDRWSARSFTGDSMPEADLLTMFEAARWSQSASNLQPWRFSYVLRDDADWQKYLGFLVPFNAGWAKEAAALVVVLSATHTAATPDHPARPIGTHALDAGAAMQSFTLQASMLGYIAHPMAGIDAQAIRDGLGLPETGYEVLAAIAVGKLGPKEKLPESLQSREAPSDRKPLSETVFRGTFKA